MQEIKNNPQVYTTQEGIEQIKSNPQVYTTQKGIYILYIYIYILFTELVCTYYKLNVFAKQNSRNRHFDNLFLIK